MNRRNAVKAAIGTVAGGLAWLFGFGGPRKASGNWPSQRERPIEDLPNDCPLVINQIIKGQPREDNPPIFGLDWNGYTYGSVDDGIRELTIHVETPGLSVPPIAAPVAFLLALKRERGEDVPGGDIYHAWGTGEFGRDDTKRAKGPRVSVYNND